MLRVLEVRGAWDSPFGTVRKKPPHPGTHRLIGREAVRQEHSLSSDS